MAANSFKKGSGKDEMARRILESAMSTLIAIDTNHNYVLEGSTVAKPTLTEAGTKLVASMQSSVNDTAGTIGDAIAGMKKSQVKKSDSIIIYDESSQSNYRIPYETLAGLIVAGAIDGGDVLTTAKLWSHMASNTEYQINISHLRDALADYLTKDKLQGLFRNEGSDAFLSKIFDDEALGVITFLSGLRSNGVAYMMKGLQIGLYQPGITGFGAKIDENGNGEFESLVVRRFLEVPELRYNRVEVLAGDKWRAPGGGIIESVTPDIDLETGAILPTGTVSLKLEEGEVGYVAVDDICMGIFHDFNDPSNNDDATSDDGFGNRTFAGFCTSYFRITEVTATTTIDGVNYYNKVFRYALRPIGGRWSRQVHPQNFMNFVVYGNFTNTSRQSSTYETTAYTRMLRAQNTWEFSWNNIGMQFGDCSLLANFDTQEEPNERANEASKYLFYIDGDIFHTGVLRRVDSHGRDIIDYYDQGVWDPNTEYFYKDRVYWNGSMWLLVREDVIDDQGVHHGITGSEPSEDNLNWLAVVYSQSVRSMGHWEATKCPYPVSAIVNLAGILYISNKETSNPPRGLLTGTVNGQTIYLKDADGKYFLIDEDEDNISEDWDVLLDIREMVAGEDAIYINLTNDADSIITDINGNIAPGTEYPTTKAQLYQGSIQITSGITWGVSAVGCSASIAPESGTVVTSNMTADKATVTISATYRNITYQKIFTFSKLFGADKYFLQPSADVIKFNPNANGGTGEYTPTTLTIRAYVINGGDKLEITSGAGLGFIRFGGNTYYSGMTVQINNMSVFTSGKLTFELFDNQATPQLQDMEEVPLVQDGLNGSSSATINLTNDTDTVCCDSDGNIDPSFPLPTTNAQLYYDLQKVTTGLTWNCDPTGCTATIEEDHDNPGEGKLTVTAMSADVASVLIFCNFRGSQYGKTFTFKKLFGADKYYLQMSGDAVVMDKTGSFRPNSITARAFCKRFGNDPIECTAQEFPHIKIACQALQQGSGYSPQSVVITDSVFTDRHLVFTLIDDSTPGDVKVLDTEDIPLVLDGTDGIDGRDGKDWHYAGMWDSEAEYKAGEVVRMGDAMYVALVDNTNKPPREILKDGVDGKYLKDENDRYLMTGSDLTDDINWNFYFRDGRDGIDGVDGIDGRDGQDGDTPVFVNLTNDTDSVICDMDGNPLEELPTTIAQFFFGSVQLLHEDGVEWSVPHLVGCTLEGETGITDDGYVQVKTMSADRAQVTIRATYKSQYYEKNFNFTKLYGTDKYVLAPNFGTVQFNPNNGTYYPTSLVLNAFVVKNGKTTDLTQASGLGYIQIGDDTQHKYYNGDSIQTATFFAVSGIEITLRDPDGVVKDKEYIPRVSDGRRGDDGDDAVTMWFDDSNIHFICDAEGTPASGQTYSTTGKLYKGDNDVALHASLSKAESTTVNCTGVLNVADNTEFILTVTGFKAGATDSNEVRITLVAADGSVSREFVVHVDKVRPGADGKSPVIYNVVPNTNVVNKDKETGVFTPATLSPSIRKSYIDANGAVAHQMLSASQALSSEEIHVYYRFDAMIHTVTEAIGNMDDGNPLTLPSSMNSYVNFAIAKSDGIILDNQSVSAISDGIDGEDGKSYISRGHWRSGEEYNVGDMVSFGGSVYRCLVASSNVPPLQCLTDGNFFLVDRNGNYIINFPIVANTANWELSIEYQRMVILDLDNESDTILYDTNGRKVSQDVVSHAILYVDGAEYVGAATYGINASGCTARIEGRTIIVTGVSGTGGTVAVTCTFNNNTYTAILSVRKLVGVNKYEIVPSANSVKKDPNNNNQYTPSAGVTFQIFRTDQTGTRRALTASDMNTGDEEGFRIGLIRGSQPEATIAINYTISPSDFEIGDCRITLYNKNNSVQDSEYIPVITEGAAGNDAVVGTALPASLIINQDITNTGNIDSPNLSETIIMEIWEGSTKIPSSLISSITVHQDSPHVYINNVNNTPTLAEDVYLTSDRFVIKGVAKDGSENYYSDANISVTIRFNVYGSSAQKTMTVPVRIYVNLLGTWKVTVENGAEQKVGNRIAYEAGPNGTVLRTAWNANITESATALRSEYTEQIGKASEYGANLFGFSKGVVFNNNIIPFIQGYGFAQKNAGQLVVNNLGFDGKGGYFTISFYAKMSSTNRTVTFNFWAQGMLDMYDPDAAISDPISFSRGISASTWTRVTQTIYIKSFRNDTQKGGQLYVDDAPGDNLLYIRQLKIERGNEVTAFTPAAEDLAVVGNGQLITALGNAGMATDRPEINGRRTDYYVYVNPSSFTTDCIDFLFQNNSFNITAGKMYTLSFWAKCSSYGMLITSYLFKPNAEIIDNSSVVYDPGTNGSQMEKLHSDGRSTIRLSTAWKQYFIHLYVTNNVTGANLIALRVIKDENLSVSGTIYMSDIRFVEGFETDEGQYKSLFEQTARRISMSVEHDLLQTGIDITHQKITLRADQVSFTNSAGNIRDKIRIDATTGTLYAEDGIFKGRIEASSGKIGGFMINDTRLTNDNWEAGIDINYDSKVLKIGKNAAGEVASEKAIIRAENTKSGQSYNTALYLNASGATNNYAFYGKGNGVLDGYMQGFKVHAITYLAGTSSSPYQVNLGNGMVQAIVSVNTDSDKYLRLPTLGEIRQTLGIKENATTNFTCQLVLINQAAIQGTSHNIDNVWVKGGLHSYNTEITSSSSTPRILRKTGDTEVGLEGATILIFHITYINKRFIANYVLG